jgi:DNA polymerase I
VNEISNPAADRPVSPGAVYLVDGTALVYRAHFAFLRTPLTTGEGEVVSAVFGFANAILHLLRHEKPAFMAVAFDTGAPTFRHEQYAAYKAHRPPMPGELVTQLPRVSRLVEALGLRKLEQEGVEADDLIGTMARSARAQGHEVVIVSADKDFMQLVSDGIRQWIPPSGSGEGQWIDPEGVRARWGVGPEKMIDLLALMGDASDNVPGVSGIGPKTAAQLIQQYDSLDGVYDHLEDLGKRAIRSKLQEERDNAYLSRELVTIRTNLPPPCSLEEMRVPSLTTRTQLVPLLQELGFRRVMESLGLREAEDWVSQVTILDTAEALREALRRWTETGAPLCLDTETTSLNTREAALVGISLAWEPGHAYYIPVGHLEGRNLPAAEVRSQLAPVMNDPKVTITGQNLKYDLHILANLGLEPVGEIRDTLLAAYLIDPEGRHSLDVLSQDHLHHRMIPITDLIGAGRAQITMDRVSIDQVAEYSGEDADVTLRLRPLLESQLESQGLIPLWVDLECPLVRVLLGMERAGVRVDTPLLAGLSVSMEKDLARLTNEIRAAAGLDFNINSPAQLSDVLFRTLKLPSRKKTKTGLSTDQEVLEELAELHPVPRLVLEHRGLSKLKGTYVDTLPELVDPRTGRIHASFNQTVAATGRLSSSDPNLQNIPIRTPQGRQIRHAFVAEEGHLLLSADYSQVELRVLAHLSQDEGLVEAFRTGRDVHAATAERIFGVPMALVDSGMRDRAKTVNFGVIYGMGAPRLARGLGISFAEARSFIEAYFDRMPGVKRYLDEVLAQARVDGYVTTIFGRRRIVRGLGGNDSRLRAQAERIVYNTPIQGSAADVIKRAMLAVSRELERGQFRSRMILQVHDELVLEVPEDEADEVEDLLRRGMEEAADLSVPLVVEVGRGRNWAEAHP